MDVRSFGSPNRSFEFLSKNDNEIKERIPKISKKEKNLEQSNVKKEIINKSNYSNIKENPEIQKKVMELKEIEQRVIAHEMAHVAVGGQYASSPTYERTQGPDGNQYIVGGEVSIDVSQEKDPQETIKKMQQVRAAAMAPADPSPQDHSVAAKASQIEMQAIQELNMNNQKDLSGVNKENMSELERYQSELLEKISKIKDEKNIYNYELGYIADLYA